MPYPVAFSLRHPKFRSTSRKVVGRKINHRMIDPTYYTVWRVVRQIDRLEKGRRTSLNPLIVNSAPRRGGPPEA